MTRIGKFIEGERERKQICVSGAGSRGEGTVLCSGTELLLGDDEHFLKLGIVAQPCEYTKSHWIVHFKRVHFMNCASVKSIGLRYKIKTKDWLSLHFPSEMEPNISFHIDLVASEVLSEHCPWVHHRDVHLRWETLKSRDDGPLWERQGPWWGHWCQCKKINQSRNALPLKPDGLGSNPAHAT